MSTSTSRPKPAYRSNTTGPAAPKPPTGMAEMLTPGTELASVTYRVWQDGVESQVSLPWAVVESANYAAVIFRSLNTGERILVNTAFIVTAFFDTEAQ